MALRRTPTVLILVLFLMLQAIAFSQPTITSVAISPAQPSDSTDLECIATVSNPSSEPYTLEYKWYKNGVEQNTAELKQLPVDSDTLFLARFDKGFDADFAKGNGKATVVGSPKIVAGKYGNALYLPAGSYLNFSAIDNINANEGTIEFLVSLDTDKLKADEAAVIFYVSSNEFSDPSESLLTLYVSRDGTAPPKISIVNGNPGIVNELSSPISSNNLTHIKFSWASDAAARISSINMFVDSRKVEPLGSFVFIPPTRFDRFYVSSPKYNSLPIAITDFSIAAKSSALPTKLASGSATVLPSSYVKNGDIWQCCAVYQTSRTCSTKRTVVAGISVESGQKVANPYLNTAEAGSQGAFDIVSQFISAIKGLLGLGN